MSSRQSDTTPAATDFVHNPVARVILIVAPLLGVLADLLLRYAPDGPGWTVWVLTLSLAVAWVTHRHGQHLTRAQVAWLAVAVGCSAMFTWRDADELRVSNVLATLTALALFGMSAVGVPSRSVFAARGRDIVAAGVYTIRDMLIGTPLLVVRDAQLQALPALKGGASWTVLRAALLTIPVVLVFTVLLAHGDPMFASLIALPNFDVGRLGSHIVVSGVFAWLSAGWLRGTLHGLGTRSVLPEQLPLQLGLVEITTALGAVVILFASFVVVQLRWLFGGADVVFVTTGLTVAEYARQGFFELIVVAMLVFPLVLGTNAVIREPKVVRYHRQLSLTLVVLLLPILMSALLRMRLYVDYYGLTTDRLYATVIAGWIGTVCIAMAFTVLRRRARSFVALVLLSGFMCLVGLNILNPELMVVRVNVGRQQAERDVDYSYLARLSGDAVPAVVRALDVAPPSPESCRAAERLRERWAGRGQDASWNLGVLRGRDAVRTGLDERSLLRLCAGVEKPGDER